MKDLSARWHLLRVVLALFGFLALITMSGCQALDAQTPSANSGRLVFINPNMNFGPTVVGSSNVLTNTLVNTTFARITLMQASINQADFTLSGPELPMTLAPGQRASFKITYTPHAQGNSSGTVFIAAGATAMSTLFTVSGRAVMPGHLTVNPASVTLGSVPVGQKRTQNTTFTNSGGTAVTVTQATVNGNGFTLSGLALPVTLNPNQSVSGTVSFAPASGGAQSGNISLTANIAMSAVAQPYFGFSNRFGWGNTVSTTVAVPLSGSGTTPGQLALTPATVNLGSVPVGSSQTQSGTVTNTGSTAVTISQAAVSGAGFNMSGISTPTTLAAGQSMNFAVRFAPSSSGASSGNVTITSDAMNPVANLALTGSGVVPGALAANPTSISFSNLQVGSNQSAPVTLTNTGGMSVTVSQAAVTGTGFSLKGLTLPLTLGAGQSTSFSVVFAPQTSGSASGNLTIASNASNNSVALPVAGNAVTPGALTVGQSSLSFGNVQVNGNQTLPETLTNSGGSPVTISQASLTGAGFSVSGLSLPLTLATGQSASFSVIFAPQAGGAVTGYLGVVSTASDSLGVSLSGSGITPGALSASSSALSFGNVQMNNNQTLPETLTNSGGSSITVSQATLTGTGFSVSGLSLPLTLAAGQSASFSVIFTPQSGTSASGNIAIASNASNSTVNVSLSGTGVTPGSLTTGQPSLSFGNVQVNNNQTLPETLTNSGGSSVTISQATLTGTGFSVSGLSLPLTLAAGQSASFSVIFTPQSGTSVSGNIAIASNASNATVNVSLSGTGVTPGSLTAGQPSLSFGNVQVNNNQSLPETLTNAGGTSVTLSQATLTGTGFSVTGLSLPLTLAAGQSASFSVIFTPQSGTSVSGNIAIASNASNSTLNVSLSGTGVTLGSLTAGQSSLSFGKVQVNNNQALPETITNSGGSSVTISQATLTGTGFSLSGLTLPLTLGAGQSASFSVVFTPQAGNAASGSLSILSNASNSTVNVSLSGTGVTPGSLTAAQPSLSFGNVQVSSNQTLSETLTNSGGTSVTVSQASLTGTGFSVSGLILPLTLAAGQSASFSVVFTPQSGTSVSGNIAIASNASNSALNVSLSGTGVTPGSLTAGPSSLSFGNVQVNNNQTLPETLTNSGGSSVTISQATLTGTGFSVSGLTLPLTLAAGQSASFSVIFTPQAGNAASGSLSILSNASNSTVNVSLSGTGVTPGSLTAGQPSLSFGNVQVSSNQTLPETLTNSGGTSVTISQATLTGTGFSVSGLTLPLTLAAGQSASFSVVFTPQSGTSVSGNIAIASNASNSTLNVSLSGTGVTPGSLSVTSSALSFGTVQLNNNQTLPETITNSGGSSVIVSQATASGPGFSVTGLSLPMTLAAGQSFTFGTGFKPTTAGSATGSIVITSNASNTSLTIAMTGTGAAVGQLLASPASLSFGNVVVGQTASMPASISASGASVTITSATFGTSEFTLSGISFPLTLAAGQSAAFQVVFTPQSSGTASDAVSFVSNAGSPAVESLGGSGIAAPQHSVALTWADAGSNVSGYNIYRSTAIGSQGTQINSTLDPSPDYTDSTVQAGQTYYYVTTAVSTSGMESTPSNQVTAKIPTP